MANVIDGAGNGGNKNIFDDINKKLKEYAQKSGNTTRNKDNSYSKALDNKSLSSNSYSQATQQEGSEEKQSFWQKLNSLLSSNMPEGTSLVSSFNTNNIGTGVDAYTKNKVTNYNAKVAAEKLMSGESSDSLGNIFGWDGVGINPHTLTEEEIDKIGGIYIDKNTKKDASNDYKLLSEDVNNTYENINKNIEALNLSAKLKKISEEDYKAKYDELSNQWKENQEREKSLSNYDFIKGNDYYQWLKQNGTEKEVQEFERYVASFDDTMLESLVNSWVATKVDFMNTIPEGYDMIKAYIDKDNPDGFKLTDENNLSTILRNTANEIRTYTQNGKNDQGIRKMTLGTISSLMPMINDAIYGYVIGSGLGLAGKALNTATSAFTNIQFGLNTAGETCRQRLAEGNTFETSFWNAVAHGTITGAVEGADVGNVTNIVNLFTGAGGTVLGVGLLSLPKATEIAYNLVQSGVGEGVEEVAEAYADKVADKITNAILNWNGSDETVNVTDTTWGGIGENGLTDQAIMAFAGAVLLGGATAIDTTINSKAKYNAAQESKKYWQQLEANSIASGDTKTASQAKAAIDLINRESQTYAQNNQYAFAVEKESDIATPCPTYEEVANITANAFKADVADTVQQAENNKQKALDIYSQLETSLKERGMYGVNKSGTDTTGVSVDTYVKMSPELRTEAKELLNYANELGVDYKIDDNFNVYRDGELVNIKLNTNENGAAAQGNVINNPFSSDVQSNSNVLSQTLAHEYVHLTENSGLYSNLEKSVKEALGEDFEAYKDKIKDLYGNRITNEEDINKEVVAKYVEENLGNKEFIHRLSNYNSSLFSRLYEDAVALLKSNPQSKVANDFFKAFRDSQKLVTSAETQYSLNDRNKDLLVVHNLQDEQLLKSLELGGFSMPSIAITKDNIGHDSYGNVSLLFDKNTIDPSNPANKIFANDAWTPTYPEVKTEINNDEYSKLHSYLYDLSEKVDKTFAQNIRNAINNYDGVATNDTIDDFIDKYKSKDYMKVAYLEDQGKHLTVEQYDKSRYTQDQIEKFEKVLSLIPSFDVTEEELINKYRDGLKEIYFDNDVVEDTKEKSAAVDRMLGLLIDRTLEYRDDKKNNNLTYKTYDLGAITDKISKEVNQEEYINWLKEKFSSMFGKQGIWNGKSYITDSGKRRTFNQLYNDYNLDNIYKSMLNDVKENGMAGGNGGILGTSNGEILARVSPEFRNIQDIINNENRLSTVEQDKYDKLITDKYELLNNLTFEIDNMKAIKGTSNPFETLEIIRSFIKDAIVLNDTNQMWDLLNRDYLPRISKQEFQPILEKILDVKKELINVPSQYFEAKPQRIVGIDEIQSAIIPNTSSQELKDSLNNNNISYAEYDPVLDGDRQRVTNQVADELGIKFSLSRNDVIKDSEGKPLTLYRGDQENISVRDLSPDNQGINKNNNEYGIYLTDSPKYANQFSTKIEASGDNLGLLNNVVGEGKVREFNVKMSNPLDLRTATEEQLKDLYAFTDQTRFGSREEFVEKMKQLQNVPNKKLIKMYIDFYELAHNSNYDGVINALDDEGNNEYIVFDNRQLNEINKQFSVSEENNKVINRLSKKFIKENNLYNMNDNDVKSVLSDISKQLDTSGSVSSENMKKLFDMYMDNAVEYGEDLSNEYKSIYRYLKDNPINTNQIKQDYKGSDVKAFMQQLREVGFTFKNGSMRSQDIVIGELLQLHPDMENVVSSNGGVQQLQDIYDYVIGLRDNMNNTAQKVTNLYDQNEVEQVATQKTLELVDDLIKRKGVISQQAARIQSQIVSNTHTKEQFNKLSNNEKSLQEMAEQAASANLTEEALDLFEEQSLQQLMEDIDADKVKESTVGKVLQEVKKDEPLSNNKKVWDKIKTAIVDKGQVIYDMAREYKSDTLVPLYDMFLQHKNVANNELANQITDEKGKKVGKSLLEISKQIPEDQRRDFDMYMYHLLNIDTAKYYKNVFNGVTADESQALVSQYELQHPEWKNVRDDYYKYAKHLRDTLVEHGRISKQTAELWEKMYPHYVPISRVLDTEVDTEGLPQTEDIKVQSTNKGTVNERTGGKSALQPLDYALAEQTRKTYKSSFLNDFAKEYVRTTNAPATQFDLQLDVDNVIDSLSGEVKAADENVPAQLIWYDDGDLRVTEISNDLYNAISSDKQYNLPESKTLQKLNNLKRNLITGHNPLFALTNTIKDAQDIIYNSKHAHKTYAMLPRAWYHLAANSDVAQLYKKYGGEYSTITSESFKETPNKLYNNTIGKIESFNNFFEMAPRLAEFMASLEEGKSPQQAMYDAQEVTTNFKRGGEVSKWADRNGATFLNASIQGFDKQVRNYQESYDRNGVKGVLSRMAKSTLISSIPLLILNHLIWKDDDDYEELSDYVKDNYYIVGKYDDGKFIRIPKGRVAAAYQSIITGLYENGQELINDDSLTEKASKMWDNSIDSLLNVWDNIGVNNPLQNNLISPIIQVANNESWYGDPIVSEYMAQKENAEQYDESTDKFSVWLGSVTNQSPKMINYLLNQYSGGIGDVVLPMLTPKAETDLDDGTIAGKLKSAALSPMLDKFTVDSVIKNQRISDIYTLSEELTAQSKKDNASDEVKIANKYINSIKYQMNSVNSQIKAIYNNENLSDAEKYEQARTLQKQRVELAKIGLNSYDQLDIDGTYATVNGITYSKNSENEWTKASDTKVSEYSFFGNSKQLEEFNAIESKKDSNGKTITNSKSLEKRKYLMDNGLWSDYVNNVGIDNTSTYGVSKSVYNMTDAEFKAAYNSLVSGTYKTTKTSSASGSSTKLSNKQKQAMLKYMSTIRSGENDLFTMIKNSTSIEDAKKNVEKILNKYQKS